jgi:hypothetical protein
LQPDGGASGFATQPDNAVPVSANDRGMRHLIGVEMHWPVIEGHVLIVASEEGFAMWRGDHCAGAQE